MRKVTKKFSSLLLSFSLVFSALPIYSSAAVNGSTAENTIVTSETEEAMSLWKDEKTDSELVASIPSGSEITVLEKGASFTYVSYLELSEPVEHTGYVENKFIVNAEDTANTDSELPTADSDTAVSEGSTPQQNAEPADNSTETSESSAAIPKASRASISSTAETGSSDQTLNSAGTDHTGTAASTEDANSTETESADIQASGITSTQSTGTEVEAAAEEGAETELMTGIALKGPTNIYAQTNEESRVLKSYAQGTLLKYQSFTTSWYRCTVYINGKATAGFIKKTDVENTVAPQVWMTGVTLPAIMNVYSKASITSKPLKSYLQGTVVKYKTFISGWYQSTVYINGVAAICYIRKSDVENTITPQQWLNGISLNTTMNVYNRASTAGKVLKTYPQGTLLKYKTFSSTWYQSSVYIKGKATVVYIKKSGVENTVSPQKWVKGIVKYSKLNVYSRASTSSRALKSYVQGSILSYKTFTSGWYQSTVYINGKATTCYLRKSDVENAVSEQQSLRGVTRYAKTYVYSRASASSTDLKSYAQGSVLSYKTFTSGWYQSTVYINGKATTCYIRKSDVENTISPVQNLEGLTMKEPVSIYSKATGNSNILRNYKKGVILKFWPLTSDWYETNIYINGKATRGYIKAGDIKVLEDDINFVRESTDYGLSLEEAADMQMKVNPQTDSSGSWSTAPRSEVEHYLNPANFAQTSTAYYQFLVLSSYAGTDQDELNNKILAGKGVLEGKGSSYITAAKEYGVNEIYLVSHSLLETGNGLSRLANGVAVNGVTVYNVYGIGAIDSDPLGGGSQFAYEQGWTSVEKAIEGGAKFVADNYISKGQNTLYKMRWNPDGMERYGYANHQYASDVGWAVKQTDRIVSMYNQLSRYTLVFDLPTYYL
ncbi:glucosaminidase domain-containing protein [Peribacillus sp. SCS-155]|uniref:glucosaminidase domain-containing protein n=1 Tax=Peribacillus sedimenti TaxID=3115297 RepID=UPI0039067699